MNLAPWKYRNILRDQGGPVTSIETRRLPVDQHEAYVHLDPKLQLERGEVSSIYANRDGSGTSEYPHVARYKAISESLERWAFWATVKSGDYGFNHDPSTNGVAAYPGLFAQQSREFAFNEAYERFILGEWWQGRASAKLISGREAVHKNFEVSSVQSFEILGSRSDRHVALLEAKSIHGFTTYGFACRKEIAQAIEAAKIELYRNICVLERAKSETRKAATLNEKRLVYFASADGHKRFTEKLNDSLKLNPPTRMPRLIVDQEISGPWSQYAHVWRCLFETDFGWYRSTELEEFFF